MQRATKLWFDDFVFGELEQEVLASGTFEVDEGFAVFAVAFDRKDFAAAETFVFDELTR